jgi:aminopeptidase N
MRTDTAVAIHRQDYQPPAYLVESIDIGFDLDPGHTRVAARSTLQAKRTHLARRFIAAACVTDEWKNPR